MSDNDILKQIALLNPRIINGNEGGNNVDYILNNGSSSPSEVNTDITDNQLVENDDDNDILNLWSSTKIFFDPFDPSKINTTHSQNSLSTPSLNSNNIDAGQLSEREIDRQRYNRLKQQQQSIYAQRGRRSLKENSEHNNIFNKNNLLDINNFEHFLLNNNNTDNDNHNHNNNNNKNAVENSLLQASTSTNTAHSLATTQSIIQNISLPANNNVTKLNSINNNQDFNKKNKDLYTQLLDSINIIKDDDINANGKRNGVSKTNESRSKELAEKKKRRSAATMRCRERKKNQLQKKEQYIKYLENQILFLNGSILHMSNEITWLRRSFLDQYGEQSLKNIYLKNGFKDVNLNTVLYPGSNGGDFPDFNSTNPTNLLSQELSLNNINLGNHQDLQNREHNKQEEKGSSYHQNQTSSLHTSSLESTVFLNSLSPHEDINKNHTLTTTPVQTSHSTNSSANSNSKSFTNNINKTSHVSSTTTNCNSLSTTAIPESLSNQNQNQNQNQKNIIDQLDMETLTQFAKLSNEQRDVLLKILEKQQELSQQQKSKPIASSSSHQSQNINVSLASSPPSSRNFINIANDEETINHYSKPQSSLLNLESVSTSVPATSTITHFNNLTTNSIYNTYHSQSINSISFQNTSLPPSTSNNITTTTSELLNSLSSTAQNSPEKDKSSNDIPTSNISNPTTTTQQDNYIDLENLIYYI